MSALGEFVEAFASAFEAADARAPAWTTAKGRAYRPGLGPHPEDAAVRLTLAELRERPPFDLTPVGQALPYPPPSRQKCDIWVGDPLELALEVKMARFRGDNGKPDDTAVKDILSPYESDRSALADCVKLARAGFDCDKAILIYGFDYDDKPLDPVIDAFELIAREQLNVPLGPRYVEPIQSLVHPVHSGGRVFGWQV
jgi:hypothetical protein